MNRGVRHRLRAPLFLATMFLLGLAGCNSDNEPAVFYNPLDPVNRPDLPVPSPVVVEAGTSRLRIYWALPAGVSAEEFAIFRRLVDETGATVEKQFLLNRTTQMFYEDATVKNGLRYAYNVASGEGGQFGGRSEDAFGVPALFHVVLNDDAESTRDRVLTVQFVAPTGTESVLLFEGSDGTGASWRPFGQGTTWTLSPGDGPRQVSARFRLADGSVSLPVSDEIRLDTTARIGEVTFDGDDVRAPGDPIHFRLVAGETGGTARVEVIGLFLAVALYDDGTNGDVIAGDGIYELDTLVPAGQTVTGSIVTGRFTDALGNEALAVEADRRLSVQVVPDAVGLADPTTAVPPAAPGVLLQWTVSPATDFAGYRLTRSETGAADPTPRTIVLLQQRGEIQYLDTAVREGGEYTYQVTVISNAGLESASNPATVLVPNLRPPAAVALLPADGISISRAVIRWGRSNDLDFGAYRLYRSTNGAVDESATLVATLSSADATTYVDEALDENTVYYYRVFVADQGGLVAGSNEISARTQNVAPPPVQLSPATSVTATGVTLSWGASDVDDFSGYRLYRGETPNVTTAATLIKDVDERAATSFRDTTVRPATTFYYRVYVIDDGVDPGPLSAGSNTIAVTTPAN